MKNRIKFFGIIALAAIIGFVLAACGGDEDNHEHKWGSWSVTTPATCTTAGMETRVCSLDSSHKETRSVAIDPDAHDWDKWKVETAPTCTETGEGKRECILCGEEYPDTVIPALGHNYGNWTTTEPITSITDVEETRMCANDSSHIDIRTFTLTEYLSAFPGNTRDTPYSITMNVDDLTGVSTMIIASGRYINLDLSGSNLTSIPADAFSGCSFLTSIIIPDSVNSIGMMAFVNCYYLKSINIPEGVTNIEFYAFASAGVVSFTIPSSVISIGMSALAAGNGNTEINVDPDNLVYSSVDGVLYNKELTSLIQYPSNKVGATVNISDSITSIADRAFMNAGYLTAINVDTGNSFYSSVDGVLYNKELTTLICYPVGRSGELIIPNGVTNISDVSFNGSMVTSLTIPASVESIGSQAFLNCSSLVSVTFEGNITEANFNSYAFQSSDLREKYFAVDGGIGTYTRAGSVWTKQ